MEGQKTNWDFQQLEYDLTEEDLMQCHKSLVRDYKKQEAARDNSRIQFTLDQFAEGFCIELVDKVTRDETIVRDIRRKDGPECSGENTDCSVDAGIRTTPAVQRPNATGHGEIKNETTGNGDYQNNSLKVDGRKITTNQEGAIKVVENTVMNPAFTGADGEKLLTLGVPYALDPNTNVKVKEVGGKAEHLKVELTGQRKTSHRSKRFKKRIIGFFRRLQCHKALSSSSNLLMNESTE